MRRMSLFICVLLSLSAAPSLFGQSSISILLPERTRLLDDQRFDLVVEVRNAASLSEFRVIANGVNITEQFRGPKPAALDCDSTPDYVFRADLMSFKITPYFYDPDYTQVQGSKTDHFSLKIPTAGWVELEASIKTSAGLFRSRKDILVQKFILPVKPRNAILFIGDAMAEAYRDAARLVARSVETVPGLPGLREGFYDRLLEMDSMPVSGMCLNHGSDRVIPDSANSASALATGNKTFDGAISVFADGTDCAWIKPGASLANQWAFLDNPKIETIAEYLKRRLNYRVGLVTTAALADATPAAFGSHTGERDAAFEVIRQYFENPVLGGQPIADVLMGGGAESFDPKIRADGRDLVAEFRALGYKVVTTATELKKLGTNPGQVLGLFKQPTGVSRHNSGIRPSSAGHMNVAYDKLGLRRPGSEPLPNFGNYPDQPFLDDMARKAIEILSGPAGDQPFILLVEGASIDKQSHSGHAAGTIWDTIELDKAVGVGRAWARARRTDDTLLVVTADHAQTMTVMGLAEVPDQDYFDRTNTFKTSVISPIGEHTATVYRDVNTSVRAGLPYGSAGGGDGPPAYKIGNIFATEGFPDYIDENGDGYPENRNVGGKGRLRISVGFRTGNHAGLSLPLTAEGPGSFLFTGYMDQTDVPLKIGAALGNNTSEADALLKEMMSNPLYPATVGRK